MYIFVDNSFTIFQKYENCLCVYFEILLYKGLFIVEEINFNLFTLIVKTTRVHSFRKYVAFVNFVFTEMLLICFIKGGEFNYIRKKHEMVYKLFRVKCEIFNTLYCPFE